MDTNSGLKRFRLGCAVVNGQRVDYEIEVELDRLTEYTKAAYERRDRHGAGVVTLCDGIVLMVS